MLEVLEDLGAPHEEFLKRAHLPVLAVHDGATLVPTARVYDFVALASRETGIGDLGLRAGNRYRIETLLPNPEWAWRRPGVFRSLESFIEAALESSSNVDMWLESRADSVGTTEFFYRGTFGPDHEAFQAVEQFMVAVMVRWVRFGAGPKWNPTRVNVRSPSVPMSAMRDLVGEATVRPGQGVTSIVFPSQQFLGPMKPFPERGSEIWRRHRRALEKVDAIEDLGGSLRLILRSYLPDGSLTVQRAAELTGMSVRTLQRRLKSAGLSYSQLLEALRHDLALYLLRNPKLQASQVSFELGYRDPAIFTRAFRRWTGQTPSQYRQAAGLSRPHTDVKTVGLRSS